VSISLELSDRIADIVAEGIDLAIRIGHLEDSSLVGVKLAANRRVVVASPAYLAGRGTPLTPADLAGHQCLTFGRYGNQARGWLFALEGRLEAVRVNGAMECNDGAVLLDWARAGFGLAWRSMWEVAEDLARGELVTVLDDFSAPDTAIYAVFPQRRHLALRVRMLVDFLKATYGTADYWPQPSAGTA
jgi:DNA-binding transcriptional LysR family regulator